MAEQEDGSIQARLESAEQTIQRLTQRIKVLERFVYAPAPHEQTTTAPPPVTTAPLPRMSPDPTRQPAVST